MRFSIGSECTFLARSALAAGILATFATGLLSCGGSAKARRIDELLELCDTVCECNDGVDNDGDGLVDWVYDQGCSARNDLTEGGIATGSTEGGWTIVEPSGDTRIVYVSSSVGNDSFDGLAPEPGAGGAGPKRSLGAAGQLLRDGFPDWLLLRRGDTWNEGLPLERSGRSETEPMLVASYGSVTTRPVLTIDSGISDQDNVSHLVILHLDFDDSMITALGGEDITIEGCRFSNGHGAIHLGAVSPVVTHRDFRLRRNVAIRTRSNTIYVTFTDGLLLEENIIYRPSIDEAGNHGLYATRNGNTGVVARGNIVFVGKPEGNGIMLRPGGLAEGNVVADFGWSGITLGACNDEGGDPPCHPPVEGTARDNLTLERHAPIGCGVQFIEAHISSGEATNNAVADDGSGAICNPVQAASPVVETGTVYVQGPSDPTQPDLTFLGAVAAREGFDGTTEEFFRVAVEQRKFSYRPEFGAPAVIALFRSLR